MNIQGRKIQNCRQNNIICKVSFFFMVSSLSDRFWPSKNENRHYQHIWKTASSKTKQNSSNTQKRSIYRAIVLLQKIHLRWNIFNVVHIYVSSLKNQRRTDNKIILINIYCVTVYYIQGLRLADLKGKWVILIFPGKYLSIFDNESCSTMSSADT